MSDETVILTEKRQQFLENEYEGTDSARATMKSRLKSRSKIGFDDLVKVAQSDQIDNSDVFDPDAVASLFAALMIDPAQMDLDRGGLRVGENYDVPADVDDSIVSEYSEELREYRRELIERVSPVVVAELDAVFRAGSGSSE